MTDSKTVTERQYCEGHFKLFSIRCLRCKIRSDCHLVTAMNDYLDWRYNQNGKR